ncbi:B3 domain-containing protein_Os12g40080-like [Aegilops tauschii subsp. strangulata]|uniref:B3 domain-containing protein_Os12g40080-like n=1 Tax=Aegilops tauschii subsp. strangulata TaxID=200361 RepID=UPI00098B2714
MEELEFFIILLPNFLKKLRLPGKFTKVLDGCEHREVKLREDGRRRPLWDVEVVTDADGHMYLGHGWEQFAHAHDMRLGHFLVLSYDGHAVLTVKVCDGSMCRRHYQHDNNASIWLCLLFFAFLSIRREQRGKGKCHRTQGEKKKTGRRNIFTAEDPVDSANIQMLSNNYLLSVQCYLTKAQKVKIDVLIEKIQPKITVLVLQMKKSNAKQHANLVIQKNYAVEHFPHEDTIVILQPPGKNKDWKSTFRIRPSGVSGAEENSPVDEAMELDDVQTLSKDYVLSGKCDHTVAQGAKIDALIDKIRPEIPVLVVQMKKSSANRATLLRTFSCYHTV